MWVNRRAKWNDATTRSLLVKRWHESSGSSSSFSGVTLPVVLGIRFNYIRFLGVGCLKILDSENHRSIIFIHSCFTNCVWDFNFWFLLWKLFNFRNCRHVLDDILNDLISFCCMRWAKYWLKFENFLIINDVYDLILEFNFSFFVRCEYW